MLPGCFAWKNNSVGIYDPIKKLYRKSRNKFAINGVSDIIGIYCCRPLFIEVKTPKTRNRLTDEQVYFLEKTSNLGAIVIIATSVEDVRIELNRHVKEF